MTPRLTTRRRGLLEKAAADEWLRLFVEFEDIPGHGVSKRDVVAMVNMGLIRLRPEQWQRGGQRVELTEEGANMLAGSGSGQ